MSQLKDRLGDVKQPAKPAHSPKGAAKRPTREDRHRLLVDVQFAIPLIREDEYFPQVHGYGEQRFAEATIYSGV